MKVNLEQLQEVVEKIAYQQTTEDQSDDLFNKMGILNDYVAEQLILFSVSQQGELLLAYEKSQYDTTWWMSEGEITNRINDFLANNCG